MRALKGKGLNFTFGDVIALMVLDSATRQLGCPISLLAPRSPELFEACGRLPLTIGLSNFIVFRGDSVTMSPDWTHIAAEPLETPFIVVPLAPILERLREWMSQGQLALPL